MSSVLHAARSAFLRFGISLLFLQCLVANAQVTRLSFRPVDAAYSKLLDRLILLSSNPNQLHIFNAATQSDQTVAFSDVPTNMSLSSDGSHAAVAFSTSVAYVDLQSATVERTFAAAVGTGKVIVGAGYIYVMPSYVGSPISINLADGQITTPSSFFYASRGVYNPAVNAIYSTTDGSSPNSVSRYDASGVLGSATPQPAAYWGNLSVCGPLSLSEDGGTIYTGCGTILRSSSDPNQDMRYAGVLPGARAVQGVVQSATLHQLAAIASVRSSDSSSAPTDDTVVNLFESTYFNPTGRISTTPFTVNSRSYPAHGRWVFYNSSSSALIIVSQADATASITQDFEVESVDLTNPNSCGALFGTASASASAAGSYLTTPILSGPNCLFTAVSNSPWITLSSGYYGSGNTSLTYLVRPNLGSSARSGTISIGSQTFTVNQEGQAVTSTSHSTPLSFKPVAADYNKVLDKVVMVSASPNELHLYDPVTQDDAVTPLNSTPLSVSVRPDGLFAAVGNQASISIVDLTARAITQTIPVDMDVAGIVLGSNGYVYAFSPSYSYAVYSVQLATGTLTSTYSTSSATPRLDPTGRYIYLGIGYRTINKLDISNGPAVNSSGAYAGNQSVWLSEGGERLLTASGYAYLTSLSPSLDGTPNGRLNGTGSVASAANSQRLGQTAVLTDVNPNANTQLQIYSDGGLQLQRQLELPAFTNAGATYISHGRYVFWNSGASKLFAITQADFTSRLLSDFAIQTLDPVSSIPACSYAVSPGQLTVPSNGYGSWFFDVTSNCTWGASIVGYNDWLSFNNFYNYTTGNSRAYFNAYTNSGADRSASVAIGDQTVVVNQTAAGCSYSLSSTSGSMSRNGGRADVSLVTGPNCRWSLQSLAPWLSFVTGQSGTGPATITYSVDPVPAGSGLRSGSLNIAGQSYYVSQNAGSDPVASDFVPVTPCRIADTRNAQGPFGGPFLGASSSRTFVIPQANCNIPNTATAYSLNITVVPRGPLNYLTAWPDGQARPFVSTLNSGDGRVKANAAIIAAGPNHAVDFFATNPTDLIVDITGYFVDATTGTGLAFYPVTPCRIADTREPDGPLNGPVLAGGEVRQMPVLQSQCSLSQSALAYSLNFTAIPDEDRLQYLTIWPSGQDKPFVSTLNSWTGTVVANAAILSAGTGGDISVFVTEDSHLAIDTNGYFAPAGNGGLHFYNLSPCRVLDTRITTPNAQPFRGNLPVQIAGYCSVPSNASAVVVNSTVVPVGRLDYLTLWPSGNQQPFVSTLNAFDGSISSNMAIVPVSQGMLSAFSTQNTHLLLDVTGYFAP